jgi:hypothetical protein
MCTIDVLCVIFVGDVPNSSSWTHLEHSCKILEQRCPRDVLSISQPKSTYINMCFSGSRSVVRMESVPNRGTPNVISPNWGCFLELALHHVLRTISHSRDGKSYYAAHISWIPRNKNCVCPITLYLTKPNGICFLAQHGLVSRFGTLKSHSWSWLNLICSFALAECPSWKKSPLLFVSHGKHHNCPYCHNLRLQCPMFKRTQISCTYYNITINIYIYTYHYPSKYHHKMAAYIELQSPCLMVTLQ